MLTTCGLKTALVLPKKSDGLFLTADETKDRRAKLQITTVEKIYSFENFIKNIRIS